MVITLIILALSAFFFVNGKIRSYVVALCALVLLILCGILTPEEALVRGGGGHISNRIG